MQQQYEIIISDVVDYDGVSNEAVLPNDDYIGNDGKVIYGLENKELFWLWPKFKTS